MDYIISRDDLHDIILKQIETIEKFKNNYVLIVNLFLKEDKNDDLNQIIKEYRKKLKVLSMSYNRVLKWQREFQRQESKKYHESISLFDSEFHRRIDKIDEQLDSLRNKLKNDNISRDIKSELSSLIVEYNGVSEWLCDIESATVKGDSKSFSDSCWKFRRCISSRITKISYLKICCDFLLDINPSLDEINNLLNEMRKYVDYEDLINMIDNKILDESKFYILKRNFENRYKLLPKPESFYNRLVDDAELIISEKCFNYKTLYQEVSSMIESVPFFNKSWDSLFFSINSFKEDEKGRQNSREFQNKIKELREQLNSAIDFIVNISKKKLSINNIYQEKESLADLDAVINLCNRIKSQMVKIPYFSERRNNILSPVYELDCDYKLILKILKTYPKFINKMASFADYIMFCSKNNDRLERLFKTLKETYELLLKSFDSQTYNLYQKQINEIKEILKEGKDALSKIDASTLQDYADHGIFEEYRILSGRIQYFTSSFNEVLRLEFDLSPYKKYQTLTKNINDWIYKYSPEQVKNIIGYQKIHDIKEKVLKIRDEIDKLLKDKGNGQPIDWQIVIVSKNLLFEILNEIRQIVTYNDMEHDLSSSYWELYQDLSAFIETIPTSDEKYIEQLKLQVLKSLKLYKEYQKQVNKASVLSNDDLTNYIKSYCQYLMEVAILKHFVSFSTDNKSMILDSKMKVYQTVVGELTSLEVKSPYASELKKEYMDKINILNKELFYAQSENMNPNVDPNLLWQQKVLEDELQANPSNESTFLKYLEIVGRIAKEKYLSESFEGQDKISNSIRDIESQRESLISQKQVLNSYIEKGLLTSLEIEQKFSTIQDELDDYDLQLKILKL